MGILSRLFGRRADPEAKASAFGSLVSWSMVGRPTWQRRNFEQVAKEAYQQNVVAYACVWLTACAAADIELEIVQAKGDGSMQEARSPELARLLARPNKETNGNRFIKSVVADLMLGGNVFIERVDGLGGVPLELHRLIPSRVSVVVGPNGSPMAYEYRQNGGVKRIPVDYDAGEVPILHIRDYSPIDDWYGMAGTDPAAFAIDSHSGAAAWNKAILDNSARPSGALVYAPKEGSQKLADDQWAKLKVQLETAFSGQKNAGKPILLDGGLDWKQMGLSPKDMDFVEGKNAAARDIALGYGVPPMILGIPGDNTYSNYQEANRAWYRQAVLPRLNEVCRELSFWIGEEFGKGLAVQPCIDEIPAFAEERAARWKQIDEATDLTINEKRAAKGKPPAPGGDVILVPSSMVPLEAAGAMPAGGAAPDAGDAEGDVGGGSADTEA